MKTRRIEPPKITEWREVIDEYDLAHALADVTSPGFGNVGKHIGYIVRPSSKMQKWNFEDKLNLQWLLDHPQPRIKAYYEHATYGGPVAGVTVKNYDEE